MEVLGEIPHLGQEAESIRDQIENGMKCQVLLGRRIQEACNIDRHDMSFIEFLRHQFCASVCTCVYPFALGTYSYVSILSFISGLIHRDEKVNGQILALAETLGWQQAVTPEALDRIKAMTPPGTS